MLKKRHKETTEKYIRQEIKKKKSAMKSGLIDIHLIKKLKYKRG